MRAGDVKRIISLIAGVVVSLGWYTSSGDMRGKMVSAANDLPSTNFLHATECTRTLFSGGAQAIPVLVSKLEDRSEYAGLCGRRILESQMKPGSFESFDFGFRPGDPPGRTSVREVALYLLVAVLRGNLYFAEVCKPVLASGNEPDQLDQALEGIRSIYEKAASRKEVLDLKSVEGILKANGVVFVGSSKKEQ